ncbi:hypothetical protein C0989_002391 [Termitomyces sp. Mn162]|nr:hypothetical protein C0989_002391 [Termitomyces sp. Mn162]
MPEPQQVWNVIPGNRLLQEETDYDIEELKRRVDENKARFNGEQLGAFNEADVAKDLSATLWLLLFSSMEM